MERRRLSLQRFVQRVASHPVLQKSEALRNFLEREYLPTHTGGMLTGGARSGGADGSGSVLESLSDALINAFSKNSHHQDERFLSLKRDVSKYLEHLEAIERIMVKFLKHNAGTTHTFR